MRLDYKWDSPSEEYVSLAEKLDRLEENEIEEVSEKEEIYQELRSSKPFEKEKLALDVWTAAFFWPLDGTADEYPTPNIIEQIRRNPPDSTNKKLSELSGLRELRKRASNIAEEESFFHWPLEFPAVFSSSGGFDCILGNPPWERLEVVEEEYFAVSQPEIANARNASKRKDLITELEEINPELYNKYQKDKKRIEQRTNFLHNSGRYPLTGRGNLNTYALFSELSINEINGKGRSGIIVPTGIATNSRTKHYFAHLIENERLDSLIDFENKYGIFPDVHKSYRFCLLSVVGSEHTQQKFRLAFDLTEVEQLHDKDQYFTLDRETIQQINPNTNNLPTFDDPADARLVSKIYDDVGALRVKDQEGGNSWNIESGGEFHMSHDSGSFRTKKELQKDGWKLENNVFTKQDDKYLPLYESKLFHQFNHRYATFEGTSQEDIDNGKARELTLEELNDIQKVAIPRYWIPEHEYLDKHDGDWHLALRTITRSTDSRTVIGSILPRVGAADSLSVFNGPDASQSLILISLLNSYVLDYVARQKISGSNLNYYMIWQLPVPSPNYVNAFEINGESVKSRIQELAYRLGYTAQDLEEFAQQTEFNHGPYPYDGGDHFSRDDIRHELEAIIAHLYGVDEGDFDRIFQVFSQIKEEDLQKYGHYRTRERIKEKFLGIKPNLSIGEY